MTTYATSFPTVENPLSESGKWQRGLAEGLDWNNPKVVATNGVTASVNAGLGATRFDDNIAHLKKSFIDFADDHYAQAVIYRQPAYDPGGLGAKHEVELLLRFEITAHGARGYEFIWGEDNTGGYNALVRWNGAQGSFDELWSAVSPAMADGDVFKAQIIGNDALFYRNTSLISTTNILAFDGLGFTEGQPGLGFWPIDGAVTVAFGFKSWTAVDATATTNPIGRGML